MALGGLAPITTAMTRYEMLDVAPDASSDDLHRAYRRMALLYHPDRHPAEDEAAAETSFRLISDAFQLLSDPVKRERYDRALATGQEYTDSDEATIDIRDVLRGMEEYEDPADTNLLSGKLSELSSLVSENLIKEIGEHVMDVWGIDAPPPGVTVQGTFKAGAAVLTNVRLLVPFVSQWVTTNGNVKTTHAAPYMLLCALHLTNRIEIEETDKLVCVLRVRFVQHDRTVEFRTGRHNMAKLLLVARRWSIPVQALLKTDKAREQKWAFGPIRWLPWIACIYLVCAVIGLFLFSDDGLVAAIRDGWGSLYPFGAWMGLLFVTWSIHRLCLWIRAYGSKELIDLAGAVVVAGNTTLVQRAEDQ